ncbi:hypothetical protein SDC9_131881 [bioreactor metagenome]|uniref:Uncharacterized protein n=1 Tax=bioreactor metagenome TaxID=1076179 RepID=A0A645D6I8_9ZZZZ
MHGGAGVDAELAGAAGDDACGQVPLVQGRVEEDADGAEYHDRGHRHCDLICACLDDRLGAQHGRRAADGAARADQHDLLAVHAQPARADEHGEHEGAADDDGVDRHTRQADMRNVGRGQAETVEHDAQAQQGLLGVADARARRWGQAAIDRVAQHHADHDGQREHTETVRGQPFVLAEIGGRGCNGCAQGDARHTLEPDGAQRRWSVVGGSFGCGHGGVLRFGFLADRGLRPRSSLSFSFL